VRCGWCPLDLGEQRGDHPVPPAGQRLPDAFGECPADGGALAAVQLRCLGEGAVREPDDEVGGAGRGARDRHDLRVDVPLMKRRYSRVAVFACAVGNPGRL